METRTETIKILCPNGHLGFAPLRPESFHRGVAERPDYLVADSGSCDIGPGPLGSDTSTSPFDWQRHDLEEMLLAARRLKVPMIIGSAGDTGSNSRVDLYVRTIKDLAREHRLAPFKIGFFYSEVSIAYLRQCLSAGAIEGLDGRPSLTQQDLDVTTRVVAMAGVHPILALLDAGCDVIIGGRCSDSANFAAPAIHRGLVPAVAFTAGKLLECASFCAEPYGGKESVMGEISASDVKVTAMEPGQRCTVASVSAHAMYERADPYFEHVLGGTLDMRSCVYEQFDDRTCRVTGAQFIESSVLKVKLEGAAKVGERYIGIAGIRDPYSIANIDRVIGWARSQVQERFPDNGYDLYYHRYGLDGVMGPLEPVKTPGHELCIVVEATAPSAAIAEEACMIGLRQMFYARLPEAKGTAGSVAFVVDEVMRAKPAYRWSVNHVMTVADPMELFPIHVTGSAD